jgi:transposase
MTIPPEREAQILRYYHVEKWRAGTIARQLGVHHGVVNRVLGQAGLAATMSRRHSKADPYLPFILATLEKFPALTAARLYAMVQERGYRGGPSHFRQIISYHRPRPKAEAYLRLRTLPGEQAQIDWAHFGHLEIGRARRPLMAFVIVLSYSRRIFLRFFLDARTESFLRGHAEAFLSWRGVPRVCLYDNLKSAVLERQGGAIRFNPVLLDFATHYRYEPRPVAVARGNEKGRVERAIRYVRENFFAARAFVDLADLNAQAETWCNGPAADRLCREDTARTIREVFFAEESAHLLPLPENPYPLLEQIPVKARKTPYIRFDLNDYSIPHTHVQRTLTVLADPEEVRILDGERIIARHQRSYDKGAQIESATHVQDLVEEKRAARQHRANDQLARAAPASQELLTLAAGRGHGLASITAELMQLLDRHGAAELQAAILETLSRDVPHPNGVRIALDRRREEQHQPPPVATNLSKQVKERDVIVRQPRLELYDKLKGQSDEQP